MLAFYLPSTCTLPQSVQGMFSWGCVQTEVPETVALGVETKEQGGSESQIL